MESRDECLESGPERAALRLLPASPPGNVEALGALDLPLLEQGGRSTEHLVAFARSGVAGSGNGEDRFHGATVARGALVPPGDISTMLIGEIREADRCHT